MNNVSNKYKNYIKYKLFLLHQKYFENFIFIHINKTGGSSIEKSLNLPLEHITASEKIIQIGQTFWNKKYSFTVVRNPWDKAVSHYHYRVNINQTGLGEKKINFKDWVFLTYGTQNPNYYDKPKMFMPQLNWISDKDGKQLVNYVCRFEHLNEDFKQVCNHLNLNIELPHINKTARDEYQCYYNENTKNIIKNWFHKDIKYFDYKF